MSVTPATVSVIIPTFNCARYLPEAVRSARDQTRAVDEIIVVDDGSADGTAAVARTLGGPVVYVRQPNLGIGAARNRGVEASHGDYLAFLDADDLFEPSKIARQLEHLQNRDAPDISLGQVEEFVADDLSDDERRGVRAKPGVLAGYVPGAMLISRAAFARVGPFESAWRVGEFADWYLKAMDAGLRTEILKALVLRRRLHADNIGVRERAARVDYARIMKGALDRRRSTVGSREP